MSRARIVLGRSAMAEAFRKYSVDALDLQHIDVVPVHRAFRPMAEQSAYDVSEMAIVTMIQAVEAGRPIIALPITVAARFQHRCLVQNRNFGILRPDELAGKQIAVRSFSQTTGTWVRTILDTEYNVDPSSISWLTQEAPHVYDAPEPANVIRDQNAADPADLLREGKVAAGIFGNDMPKEDWVVPVIPDPDTAARESFEKNGVVHINHVVSVSAAFATAQPELVKSIYLAFLDIKATLPEEERAMLPIGAEEMRLSVETLLGSVHRQGLTRKRLQFDEVFGEACALLA